MWGGEPTTAPATAGPTQVRGPACSQGIRPPMLGSTRGPFLAPTHVDDVGELHCDKGLSWWLGGRPHCHCHHPGSDGQRGPGKQVPRSAPANGCPDSVGNLKVLRIGDRRIPGAKVRGMPPVWCGPRLWLGSRAQANTPKPSLKLLGAAWTSLRSSCVQSQSSGPKAIEGCRRICVASTGSVLLLSPGPPGTLSSPIHPSQGLT